MPIFSGKAIGNGQEAKGVSGFQGSSVTGEGSGNESAGGSASAHQHISTSAHPNVRQTIRKVSGRDAFTTPSIRDALNDSPIQKDRTLTNITGNGFAESVNKAAPFTQDRMSEVWKMFVENIDAPQLKSALSSREPKLNDQWRIEYYLDNELQLQRLTLDLKPKLLGHLRKTLSNDLIEIEFLILAHEDEKPSVPYTESEKWQSLVEKYPALSSLKTKFGLDFEQY